MAEAKLPSSINTEESDDMKTVTVKLLIPEMKVSKPLFGAAKPKSGQSEVDVKYEPTGLEVTAKVTNGGNAKNYHYKVNKLPGEIVPGSCKTEYQKETIILKMNKKEESTWAVLLSKNGLDQDPEGN